MIKNYVVTVNGVSYDVTVEEVSGAQTQTAQAPQNAQNQKRPETKPAPERQKEKAADASSQGSVKITAGAAGKVFRIAAQPGQTVKAGDPVVVVEAMKMEIPVVAPQDGVIATLEVEAGDMVESGALLATMD